MIADFDGEGSLTSRYLRDDVVDKLFGRIDDTGACSSPVWYLSDHLGSIREVITESGIDSIVYDAFGNIITDAESRGRYGWTGREYDAEIELQYNRARYYDATTGRWISQDPMGFDAGDGNLFRYVKNRPLSDLDPSGFKPWTQDQVKSLLQATKGGAAILEALNKHIVYRVEFIEYEYKERATIGDPWPPDWKKGYVNGLILDPKGPVKKSMIFIPNKVVDTFFSPTNPPRLTDMSPISAVMALVHEVAHAKQDPSAALKDREVGAFKEQVDFLLSNPKFREKLSFRESPFYDKFLKKEDGKEVINADAINKYWKEYYEKFSGGDPKKALSITRKAEAEWNFGAIKELLKNW